MLKVKIAFVPLAGYKGDKAQAAIRAADPLDLLVTNSIYVALPRPSPLRRGGKELKSPSNLPAPPNNTAPRPLTEKNNCLHCII